ncbi:hypothetical protein GQ53DRAFT_290983 [Thozetella sp. PMI_491]|nr:hypothetical protein GQ53DRAFT_290983 [Thozetella sp. PMI_491]
MGRGRRKGALVGGDKIWMVIPWGMLSRLHPSQARKAHRMQHSAGRTFRLRPLPTLPDEPIRELPTSLPSPHRLRMPPPAANPPPQSGTFCRCFKDSDPSRRSVMHAIGRPRQKRSGGGQTERTHDRPSSQPAALGQRMGGLASHVPRIDEILPPCPASVASDRSLHTWGRRRPSLPFPPTHPFVQVARSAPRPLGCFSFCCSFGFYQRGARLSPMATHRWPRASPSPWQAPRAGWVLFDLAS